MHIYDFDRDKGELTGHKKIIVIPEDSLLSTAVFTSLEWSPSGRFIYVNTILDLYQLDTWDLDAPDALVHIATYDGFINPFATNFYLMHQSPDCKIILTPGNGTYSLHVIHKPDEKGKACDFVQNGIVLPNSNSGGLPNFPRFRVDEEEKCDPTISSIFGESVYYRRDLEVYPSPSDGRYTVKIPENTTSGHLRVRTLQGELVYNRDINHSSIVEIDITAQTSGMYVVEWYPDTSQQIFYSKIIVKM